MAATLNLQDFFGGSAPLPGGQTIATIIGFLTGFTPRSVPPFVKPSPTVLLYLGPQALGGALPNSVYGAPEYVGFWEFLSAFTGRENARQYLRAWDLKFAQLNLTRFEGRVRELAGLTPGQLSELADVIAANQRGLNAVSREEIFAGLMRIAATGGGPARGFSGGLADALRAIGANVLTPTFRVADNLGAGGAGGLITGRSRCHYPPDPKDQG